MSADGGVEGRRVEELLRVNAGLAAELRALAVDRGATPTTGPVPAARRLVALEAERDAQAAELVELRAKLVAIGEEREALRRRGDELFTEVSRLRGGWRGALRRARARLVGD